MLREDAGNAACFSTEYQILVKLKTSGDGLEKKKRSPTFSGKSLCYGFSGGVSVENG